MATMPQATADGFHELVKGTSSCTRPNEDVAVEDDRRDVDAGEHEGGRPEEPVHVEHPVRPGLAPMRLRADGQAPQDAGGQQDPGDDSAGRAVYHHSCPFTTALLRRGGRRRRSARPGRAARRRPGSRPGRARPMTRPAVSTPAPRPVPASRSKPVGAAQQHGLGQDLGHATPPRRRRRPARGRWWTAAGRRVDEVVAVLAADVQRRRKVVEVATAPSPRPTSASGAARAGGRSRPSRRAVGAQPSDAEVAAQVHAARRRRRRRRARRPPGRRPGPCRSRRDRSPSRSAGARCRRRLDLDVGAARPQGAHRGRRSRPGRRQLGERPVVAGAEHVAEHGAGRSARPSCATPRRPGARAAGCRRRRGRPSRPGGSAP